MDRRIRNHPLLKFERGREVSFIFDGEMVKGRESEDVATSLLANGIDILGWSRKLDRPRGYFCGIGKCSSCLMTIDGVPNVRSCTTPVREGMVIERQHGDPGIDPESGSGAIKSAEIEELSYDVVVVGGGVAGISAALAVSDFSGLNVTIVDESRSLGGQLLKQTHKFFGSKEEYAGLRGIEIARTLSEEVKNANIDTLLDCEVMGYYEKEKENEKEEKEAGYLLVLKENKPVIVRGEQYIVATGAYENMLLFENNDLPGIFGAGGLQTIMNLKGVLPGKKALIVGSGNVGLILAYQMLQAGADEITIIEAMGKVGGYGVHAQKIRRFCIPILLNHTIKRAIGKDKVEGAGIISLKDGKEVEGSEKLLDVDLICLAVGLTPDVRLLQQMGCSSRFIKELGGWVVDHDEDGKTSRKDVLVAGDASSIEEATTAMIEGKMSGLRCILNAQEENDAEKELKRLKSRLEEFRAGPFSEKIKRGGEKLYGTVTSEEKEAEIGAIEERTFEREGTRLIIACSQEIPCDPCVASCVRGAITKESLVSLPEIHVERCSGCGLCVSACPGLAIFLVKDWGNGTSLVTLPYEMLQFPKSEDRVKLLDSNGEIIGEGIVRSSMLSKFLVRVVAPSSIAEKVRNLKLVGKNG